MADYLHDDVKDNGVQYLITNCNKIVMNSALSTVYADANVTNLIAHKNTPTLTGPSDGTGGGRSAGVSTFTDGVVDANGNGTHYALLDTVTSKVLAAGRMSATYVMSTSFPWQLTAAIEVRIPDAA